MKLLPVAALALSLHASHAQAMNPEICTQNTAPMIYATATVAAAAGIRLIYQNTKQETPAHNTNDNNDNPVYKMTNKPKAITGYILAGASALFAASTYIYILNNC